MMKLKTAIVSTLALTSALAMPARAQDASATPQASASEDADVIVVTARKRDETLSDVPIAVTAITGDTLTARGFNSVREAAVLSPGLNINSDGTGRAFVAIRGVGVTLVQTVQPGVGLFIDGIYQPNTAYLNNPLVDVDRIEVLRGPQGTLYGKEHAGAARSMSSPASPATSSRPAPTPAMRDQTTRGWYRDRFPARLSPTRWRCEWEPPIANSRAF